MNNKIMLCSVASIEENGSKSIDIKTNRLEANLFIIRKNEQIFAYKNSCPHTGASLNWNNDQFLSEEKTHIICQNHFAIFELKTGLCLAGPCVGQSLFPVEILIEDNNIFALL